MISGARRCTPFEAYELAHSMYVDRVEASPACGVVRSGEHHRVFTTMEDLVEYLEEGSGEREATVRRSWWRRLLRWMY